MYSASAAVDAYMYMCVCTFINYHPAHSTDIWPIHKSISPPPHVP